MGWSVMVMGLGEHENRRDGRCLGRIWSWPMLAGGRRLLSGIMTFRKGAFWHGGHWEEYDGGL